eukprot:RCo041645
MERRPVDVDPSSAFRDFVRELAKVDMDEKRQRRLTYCTWNSKRLRQQKAQAKVVDPVERRMAAFQNFGVVPEMPRRSDVYQHETLRDVLVLDLPRDTPASRLKRAFVCPALGPDPVEHVYLCLPREEDE